MNIIFKANNYNCKKLSVKCNLCDHNFTFIAPSGSEICILHSTETAEFCYASVYGKTGIKPFINSKIKEGKTMDEIYNLFNKPSSGRFELNAKLRCEKCNSIDISVLNVIESNIIPELNWLELKES